MTPRTTALFTLLFGVMLAQAQTPANYTNPNNNLFGADPHVLDNRARDGNFYIFYTDGYATTRHESTDMVNWDSKGSTLSGFEGRGYVTTNESGTLAATQTGARLDYAIDILTPGLYQVWVRMAGGTGGNGSNLSEIGLGLGLFDWSYDDISGPSTQTWSWVRLPAIQSLRAGLHRLSLLRREDGHRIDRFVLTTDESYDPSTVRGGLGPLTAQPTVAANQLPKASLNTAYRAQLRGREGRAPYTFALANGSSLPAGLSMNLTGEISGTATGVPGSAQFTVVVTDATGESSESEVKIELVATLPSPVSVLTSSLPVATTGAS